MESTISLNQDSISSMKIYNEKNFSTIPQLKYFDENMLHNIRVVGHVLPFRVNQYVLNQLIDWSNIPNDPIYQLTFPQKGMLSSEHFHSVSKLLLENASKDKIYNTIHQIRQELNPHPSAQKTLNVPKINGVEAEGIQHKYKETVLFFPAQGQTCHTYCTFCFRWAQFVGDKDLRFASKDVSILQEYIRSHPNLTDVIFTGGDPLVMKTHILAEYLKIFLEPSTDHIQNIRIGTKALTYWPQRFTSDQDADDLLSLFEKLISAGKHVTIMAHYNHWKELAPDIAQHAIRRLLRTGIVIRSQGPLLKHINDDPNVWAKLWMEQVKHGIVPYYMFIERDTGPKNYFEISLENAWQIYKQANQQVSGICRTARGPSMSATPGKVEISGITSINGEKVFVLRFLQARNSEWTHIPFFAKYSPTATWFDQLQPAFDQDKFFFQKEIKD